MDYANLSSTSKPKVQQKWGKKGKNLDISIDISIVGFQFVAMNIKGWVKICISYLVYS
jgi:hypothetical protein